jgi:hypothetical protein
MAAIIHRMWMANPTPARMMAIMSSTRISPMFREVTRCLYLAN